MAIRHTVFCRRSVVDVTPAQLLAGVREADLHTIAEGDVSDAVIVDALGQLRIENVDPGGFRFYRLSYRPAGLRQLDVERWPTAAEVRAAAAEVLEGLTAPAPTRLRRHLRQTVDIVDASFGSTPAEAMAPVLASEVARWLAARFGGIIRDADDRWWKLGRRGEYRPFDA